ncbi:MAG: permease prefix domain 1-containing protein, partial [Candidatus Acidiferrum sp.]
MRDWNALVEERLAGLSLGPGERREVVEELAAHLEEIFDGYVRQGVTEEAATGRALSQVTDWQVLRRKIQRARRKEDVMTDRVKQVWLPGFLTLFLSMMLLMAIQFYGPHPLFVSTSGWRMTAPVAVIYVPWLVSLLLIGAIGAYLAGRAGASPRATLFSILFPVLPYSVFFVIWIPVSLILDDHVGHNTMLSALLMGFVAWVVLPGVALLAGGLPVQIL